MRRHGRHAAARRVLVEKAIALGMYAAKCKRVEKRVSTAPHETTAFMRDASNNFRRELDEPCRILGLSDFPRRPHGFLE